MKKGKCEIFSRCCGYYRPVENWNTAKQAEFEDRQEYDLKMAIEKDLQK